MKGRRIFPTQVAARIRGLLEMKLQSKRDEQKRIRKQLRGLGFYISDFERPNAAFGPRDFDALVASRIVSVA